MTEQPSMDEILASIRRILSSEVADDTPAPVVELTDDMRVSAQATKQVKEPVPQPVKEVKVAQSTPAPAPMPAPMPVSAPAFVPASAPTPTSAPSPTKTDALPDNVTAFDVPDYVTFNDDEIFKQVASAEKTAPSTPAVEQPVEQVPQTSDSVLLGVLRPLLREWLDKNMPRLLEKCIQEELKKTRKDPYDNPSSFRL